MVAHHCGAGTYNRLPHLSRFLFVLMPAIHCIRVRAIYHVINRGGRREAIFVVAQVSGQADRLQMEWRCHGACLLYRNNQETEGSENKLFWAADTASVCGLDCGQ